MHVVNMGWQFVLLMIMRMHMWLRVVMHELLEMCAAWVMDMRGYGLFGVEKLHTLLLGGVVEGRDLARCLVCSALIVLIRA